MSRFYIHPTAKVGELANKQVLELTAALSEMKIENDLRRQVLDDIKRLRDTGTYRGRRHALGLPVRGQNTRNQVRFESQPLLSRILWASGVANVGISSRSKLLSSSTVSSDDCDIYAFSLWGNIGGRLSYYFQLLVIA